MRYSHRLRPEPASRARPLTPGTCGRYGIIEIARTGVVGMAREAGSFTNMIEDGALVAERVLEKLEIDSRFLPPG